MKVLHTILTSRHYPHKNNIPTEEGLQIVKQNTDAIADQFTRSYDKVNVFGTDKARTGGTAKEIAKNLNLNVDAEYVKDWLSYEPQTGPLKSIYKKLCSYYDVDPDVAAKGYSDNFVYKMQHDQLEGVDFNALGSFNARKLYNTVLYIAKQHDADKVLSIVGIHGGFARESIIYTLRGDTMPKEWHGQVRMGENFILKVVELGTGEIGLSVDYRGVEKTISLIEMDAAIKMRSK